MKIGFILYICEEAMRIDMIKIRIIFAFVFLLYGVHIQAKTIPAKFDKAAFYAVIKTGTIADLDNELALVTASSITEKDAYEGFLLMRKAGLAGKPGERLRLFKAGRIKFETALLAEPDNTEYHFLRFIIEEHAPKIVKYHNDLQADKEIIIKGYKSLPAVVQQAVADYSKSSKTLHPQDL